jgi:WbqC-like protein family
VYLPWLGLFHKIASADVFVSFSGVQYLPKDWNNRNRIKTDRGPLWLTVPVLRRGHRDVAMTELEIDNRTPWARKHWRSLQLAYARAPHFRRYADFFEALYAREWTNLVELDEHVLRWLMATLQIRTEWRSAADYSFTGQKSALVLDMCRQLGASRYVFGALGRDYADVPAFEAAGIQVAFQDYRHPAYPQLHGEFVSHLSVVDLLFNCGDTSLDVLMSGQAVADSA